MDRQIDIQTDKHVVVLSVHCRQTHKYFHFLCCPSACPPCPSNLPSHSHDSHNSHQTATTTTTRHNDHFPSLCVSHSLQQYKMPNTIPNIPAAIVYKNQAKSQCLSLKLSEQPLSTPSLVSVLCYYTTHSPIRLYQSAAQPSRSVSRPLCCQRQSTRTTTTRHQRILSHDGK